MNLFARYWAPHKYRGTPKKPRYPRQLSIKVGKVKPKLFKGHRP